MHNNNITHQQSHLIVHYVWSVHVRCPFEFTSCPFLTCQLKRGAVADEVIKLTRTILSFVFILAVSTNYSTKQKKTILVALVLLSKYCGSFQNKCLTLILPQYMFHRVLFYIV